MHPLLIRPPKGPLIGLVLSKSTANSSGRYDFGHSTQLLQFYFGVAPPLLKPPNQCAQLSVANDHSPTQTGYLTFSVLAFINV